MTELGKLDRQLLAAYGCITAESIPYLQTHYERYITTLREIGPIFDCNVLEVGSNPPYAFSLMLRSEIATGELVLARGREDLSQRGQPPSRKLLTLQSSDRNFADQDFVLWEFNAESDTWPFAAGSLDLVICMEVMEHLLLDPMFVFLECNRVLRPGGRFVVTTPNLASLEGVLNLVNNRAPYRFGPYSPYGPYGRHNREFVPWEIELLGHCAGFQTERLTTFDCYPIGVGLDWVRQIIERTCGDLNLRSQTIFYEGSKSGPAAFRYPAELFAFDPGGYVAKVRLAADPQLSPDQREALIVLECTNQGQHVWGSRESGEMNIGVQLLGSDGALVERDYFRSAIQRPLGPADSVQAQFVVSLPLNQRRFGLRFDIVREGSFWLSEQPHSPSRAADLFICLDD